MPADTIDDTYDWDSHRAQLPDPVSLGDVKDVRYVGQYYCHHCPNTFFVRLGAPNEIHAPCDDGLVDLYPAPAEWVIDLHTCAVISGQATRRQVASARDVMKRDGLLVRTQGANNQPSYEPKFLESKFQVEAMEAMLDELPANPDHEEK